MKNVILDFNLLIKAEYDNTFKTGIYYVQYSIIKELINNHSDEFNFFAFSYYDEKTFLKHINTYLPEFKNIKYCNIFSKFELIKNSIKNKIYILRKKKKAEKNFLKKILLLTNIILLKIFKFVVPSITLKKYDNFDIYQSFFDAIPTKINKDNKIKKFIIIHDIIPFTNPEYIASGNKKIFDNIRNGFLKKINKITNDTTIFIPSEYSKNEFLTLFPKFRDYKIVLIPLAADFDKYYKIKNLDENEKNNILAKYHIPTDQKYILSLCSLNKRKNLAFLIESFIDFLEKNPDIIDLNLVLAGPKGWLMDEMFNSISNAEKYKDKIILTGFIDDKDINMIYNSAFMFVFPSFAEGFGLPVLEAMQCGIPVISSNTTSLPEVYGDAAIGINPTSVEELEKSIHEIYFNNDIRNKLIEDGLKQSKKFSWKKTVDNIVNEYLK